MPLPRRASAEFNFIPGGAKNMVEHENKPDSRTKNEGKKKRQPRKTSGIMKEVERTGVREQMENVLRRLQTTGKEAELWVPARYQLKAVEIARELGIHITVKNLKGKNPRRT